MLVYWKLVLSSQYTFADSPDMVNQVLPWMAVQARAWQSGQPPLWDPYHWAGQSLVGQSQPGVLHPVTVLAALAPWKDGYFALKTLHWQFVFIHLLAALSGYLLCRALRCSLAASLAGAAVWTLGGYAGSTDWVQMLNSALTAPLALMFYLRYTCAGHLFRNAAWSGAMLGLGWLGGHHQVPVFMTLVLGGLWSSECFRARIRWQRGLAALGCCLLASGLIGAPQILPAMEYGRRALRWVGSENPVEWSQKVPYLVHEQHSLTPQSVLGLVLRDSFAHVSPYVGAAAFCLALWAVWRRWRRPEVRILCIVAVAGFLFALGGNTLLHGLAYALLPFVEKARMPAAAVVVNTLALSALTAIGWDAIRFHRAHLSILAKWLAAVGGLILLFVALAQSIQPEHSSAYERLAWLAMACLGMAAAGALRRRRLISSAIFQCLLAFLLLLELSGHANAHFKHREQWTLLPGLNEIHDAVQFVKSRGIEARVHVDPAEVAFNLGDWEGVEQTRGYCGITTDIFTLFGSERFADLVSARYFISKSTPQGLGEPVFTGTAGWKVFENPQAVPMLRVVHETVQVRDAAHLRSLLKPGGLDLNRVAITSGALPLEPCEGGSARTLERTMARWNVQVDSPCRSLLVIAQEDDPNWVAAVNGRPAVILAAYAGLQGIVVEAGPSRVELSYQPKAVYRGFLLFLLGATLLAALAIGTRRSRTVR